VYLRTNLRPRGVTVSVDALTTEERGSAGDVAPYPGAAPAGSNGGSSSGSSGSSGGGGGGDGETGGGKYDHRHGPRRELARIMLPAAAAAHDDGDAADGARNDNAVTALAAHPRWHVIVAGQLDDTLVLLG
jgi:hypothetical protein